VSQIELPKTQPGYLIDAERVLKQVKTLQARHAHLLVHA
jgi:hypothetical protein